MKIYTTESVFDAALKRIRWLFDEFPNVAVSISGGKDSTVVLELALKVAKEKNRLPLKVMFIDSELEWGAVVTHIEEIMHRPEIDPLWLQFEMEMVSSLSSAHSLKSWEEGARWMRPKNPIGQHVNIYKEHRPEKLFKAVLKTIYPKQKACWISGVRADESRRRAMAVGEGRATYKWATWGGKLCKNQYTFYPIYDWALRDVWKAIHQNAWQYAKVYDRMYQHGVPLLEMRVSNLVHETSARTLFALQEIEPQTWADCCDRVPGLGMMTNLDKELIYCPTDLPWMFQSWPQYRDYLLDNLVQEEELRTRFQNRFIQMEAQYANIGAIKFMYKAQINSLLANDYEMTKIDDWEARPEVNSWREWRKGRFHRLNSKNKYILQDQSHVI